LFDIDVVVQPIPEDVAKAALVLASPAASRMTGGFVDVDGGFIAE
jgi:NAD(P)-dependent dehydrogenase (short-subunit alcohol dehydrogenase family)